MVTVLKEFIEPFITLTAEEMTELSNFIEVRSYNKSIMVTGIGDKEQYLHFVAKGNARKYFYRGKEEIVTQIASKGDLIFSTESFFSGEPSGMAIETITETVFYSIHRESIEKLYKISQKFETLGRQILSQAFVKKENREKEHLYLTTKERFKKFMNENSELFMQVSQKHLASYLNIKPETFSRLKHLLKGNKS